MIIGPILRPYFFFKMGGFNMLKITLRLNGETKTYTQDFISGYLFRKALLISDKREKFLKKVMDSETGATLEEQEELLDELYHFITEVFGNQFTVEEYERGTDARRVVDQSWEIVYRIISQVTGPLQELNVGNPTQKKKPHRKKS
ncbi:hypothetical protein CLV97_12461 [Planifilum fimeticola]|uniref:Tail assembly chaperone n=2 Tax=Planifilum fimeticola TaxID=201975 RepID=A0A2T0LC66_9BACL|nr:hypothetical protein CLV97_12461 [Planifilum fimeticola]